MKYKLSRGLVGASIIAMLSLTGCKQTPSQVILAPQINTPISHIYTNQAIALNTQDMRTNSHIIQVMEKDQPATLFSPNQAIDQVLGRSLIKYFKNQGLLVSSQAGVSMNIIIDKALVSVKQETMKYQANSDIQLRVEIVRNDKTLTTNFNSKGKSNGPLSADIAVLERDLNQQLGKLVTEIANNEEIKQFIR